jgi:membrane protease YdiL (CAAX protease family)
MPEFQQAAAAVSPSRFEGFLASFYGGIGEEILTRLFLVSVIAWILRGRAIWLAIAIAAALFAAGHLPAAASIVPLTPVLVIRTLVLNSLAGLVFGWLYWRRGLEAAMVAHFSADLVLHVLVGG